MKNGERKVEHEANQETTSGLASVVDVASVTEPAQAEAVSPTTWSPVTYAGLLPVVGEGVSLDVQIEFIAVLLAPPQEMSQSALAGTNKRGVSVPA